GKHRIASFYRPGELLGESYFDANGQPVVRNGISGRRKGAEKLETLDQDGNPTFPLAVITVSSVLSGGRAETAGVRIGDIILAYQDWKFSFAESAGDWNRAVDATATPGETLRTMTVLRDGNLQELSIAPGTLQLRLVSEASSSEWLRNATGKLNNMQD
ncbi:MAG TPA: PDZ domain-containing protein, partial [Terrimicrobiaceae bacterium]